MDLQSITSWLTQLALVLSALTAVTTVFVCFGLLIERRFSKHRIFAIPLRPGQRLRELRSTAIFQFVTALALTTFLSIDRLTWSPGWMAGVTTFFACWLGFEVYFYVLHRTMHRRGFFQFHRQHHESQVNTPLTAFSMSIPESLGWIFGYLFVPLSMSMLGFETSLAGWIGFLLYNYWGNILGHVNVELMPGVVGKRSSSWLLHAVTYHALHHARHAGHYGFGATFMDRWFSSEWSDWPALQIKVLSGEALKNFKQRG